MPVDLIDRTICTVISWLDRMSHPNPPATPPSPARPLRAAYSAPAARFDGLVRAVTDLLLAGIDLAIQEINASARGVRGWLAERFTAVAGPVFRAHAPGLAERAVDAVYQKITALSLPELVEDLDHWLRERKAPGSAPGPDATRLLTELRAAARDPG